VERQSIRRVRRRRFEAAIDLGDRPRAGALFFRNGGAIACPGLAAADRRR